MISLVLYGRNDNYGYNLHKRAAISLNCMAEVMQDPDDELIFVDYNTPNDFPTFPEAVADTLTDKCKRHLRTMRIRPHVHERFRHRTRLVALEAVSRNVAVRRSNPANRWILSTNTDIILVPRRSPSLTDAVRDLPDGFWQAPRLEIPETLWEGLDRRDAAGIIGTVRDWGRSLHLDEVVYGNPSILYDGPGDFQLMLRDTIFAIDGFHEGMLLGWHVDANLCVRMAKHHGALSDLGNDVFAYHCDHTRQITPAHSHSRQQNDETTFVHAVETADLPGQRDTWGCPDEEIEEIRLRRQSFIGYVEALNTALGPPLAAPYVATYSGATYDHAGYDARHVLPFLVDIFSAAPPGTAVAWYGFRRDTLERFCEAWGRLGRGGAILVDKAGVEAEMLASTDGTRPVEADKLRAAADVFVFDFGTTDGAPGILSPEQEAVLGPAFVAAVEAERDRLANGSAPRRFVGVNAINNRYEGLFAGHVGAGITPFSCRLRHGFVLQLTKGKQDWIQALQVGSGGERAGSLIRSRADVLDWMFYGPYRRLATGRYRLVLEIDARHTDAEQAFGQEGVSDRPAAMLEVLLGPHVVGVLLLTLRDLQAARHELEFDVPPSVAHDVNAACEVRLLPRLRMRLAASGLTVERIEGAKPEAELPERAHLLANWLGTLQVGHAGEWTKGGVRAIPGVAGYLVYGPYWSVPSGTYEISFGLTLGARSVQREAVIVFEVVAREQHLAFAAIRTRDLADGRATLQCILGTPEGTDKWTDVEFRVWVPGTFDLVLTSISVFRSGDGSAESAPSQMNLLPLMSAGPAGPAPAEGVAFRVGQHGTILDGPHWKLAAGAYDLLLEASVDVDDGEGPDAPALEIRVFCDGVLVARRLLAGGELAAGSAIAFQARTQGKPTVTLSVEVQSTGLHAGMVGRVCAVRTGPCSAARPGMTLQDAIDPAPMPVFAAPAPGIAAQDEAPAVQGAHLRPAAGTVSAAGLAPVPRRQPAPGPPFLRPRAKARGMAMAQPVGDWLPALTTGAAGQRTAGGVEGIAGQAGVVIQGPVRSLPVGTYELRFSFSPFVADEMGGDPATSRAAVGALLEVLCNDRPVAALPLRQTDLSDALHVVLFEVTSDNAGGSHGAVRMRLHSAGGSPFAMSSCRVENIGARRLLDPNGTCLHEVGDWTPVLSVGNVGCREGMAVVARRGADGHMVFGPYWRLPAGRYEARFRFLLAAADSLPQGAHVAAVEVAAGGTILSHCYVAYAAKGEAAIALPFVISRSDDRSEIEFRAWTAGTAEIILAGLQVRHVPGEANPPVTERKSAGKNRLLGKLRAFWD